MLRPIDAGVKVHCLHLRQIESGEKEVNISRQVPISRTRSALAVAVSAVTFAGLLSSSGMARADTPLIYVPLAQPCRLLDTRASNGGPGPLTQAHGNYQFSTT